MRDRKVQVGDHRLAVARLVREADILERHGAERRHRQRLRVRRRLDRRLGVENFDQPLGGAGHRMDQPHDLRQVGQRVARHQRVDHELRQLAHGDDAGKHRVGAPPDQHHQRCGGQEQQPAEQRGARPDPADFGLERFLGARTIQPRLLGLLHEALDRLARPERLGRHRRHVGQGVLGAPRHPPQPAGVEHYRNENRRPDDDDGQREIRAGEEHQRHGADQRHRSAQHDRQARADGAADRRHVAVEPRGELTHPMQVEERRVERQQVVEHLPAQIGEDTLAQHRDEIEPAGAGQRHYQRHADGDQPILTDHGEVLLDEPPCR